MAIPRKHIPLIRRVIRPLIVVFGGAGMAALFFIVLPLMQTIAAGPDDVVDLTTFQAAVDKPPPPVEEKKEEPPKDEEKPKLDEVPQERQLLDLESMSLSLNAGGSDGGGVTVVSLLPTGTTAGPSAGAGVDEGLFGEDQLDQKPRVIRQNAPSLTGKVRERARQFPHGGTVFLIFIVNKDGQVENPLVQKSLDPVLDEAALAAVKSWKFEPGKRKGEPVRFRMRVPIQYPRAM